MPLDGVNYEVFEHTFEIGEDPPRRISPATDPSGGASPPLVPAPLGRIVGSRPGVGKHLTGADTVVGRLPPADGPHLCGREEAAVNGEHDTPVEVRLDGDTPAEFVLAEQVYIVRDVLARWIESAPWWHSPTTTGIPADLGERVLWRVVASGAEGESRVLDLAFDRARSKWFLVVEPE